MSPAGYAYKSAKTPSQILIVLTTLYCLLGIQDHYSTALANMEEEASKFALHVSWAKTKVQNLGSGSNATEVNVNGHIINAVNYFIYLGCMQFVTITLSYGNCCHCNVHVKVGVCNNTQASPQISNVFVLEFVLVFI